MPVPDPDQKVVSADQGWSRLMRALGTTTPRRLRDVQAARAGLRVIRGAR